MLIKHDEAAKYICPYKLGGDPGNKKIHCEGSRCMAWWGVESFGDARGYCGLAVNTPD